MTTLAKDTTPRTSEPTTTPAEQDMARPAGAPAGHDGSRASGPVARLLIGCVRLYQAARVGHPSPCRYIPSCSTYAVEAVERHGARRGSWLAARRLCRCHPWGGHGADPVPE